MENLNDILQKLGAKPSKSEEKGLALITESYKNIFSPGISTGGFAEIKMAKANLNRNIIATTIDEKGLKEAEKNIRQMGLSNQILTKKEDITREFPYNKNQFDFIYARLILHYLSSKELDSVLTKLYLVLENNGLIFLVIPSTKNLIDNKDRSEFDPETCLTKMSKLDNNGKVVSSWKRYFHTIETITGHLKLAGFKIKHTKEYSEKVYIDFKREKPSSKPYQLIEVLAQK